MYRYKINSALAPLEKESELGESVLVLLTSDELERGILVPGLEQILCHTPSAKDSHVCKAEYRNRCICGTIVTPRKTRKHDIIAFGFLLTSRLVVICDDIGAANSAVHQLRKKNLPIDSGVGSFFYEFLELLIDKDLHHLQELESSLDELEEQVLNGEIIEFNSKMNELRKEITSWIRYYTQLNDMVCEIQENENGYFSDSEIGMFHMLEKRIRLLNSEAQMLREYSIQMRELFQAEIDIRQNRIMKTLTIVTTIFLPLSLIVGWYGMNFFNMPELSWKYGYMTIIIASILIVFICLWIMKKKKFW